MCGNKYSRCALALALARCAICRRIRYEPVKSIEMYCNAFMMCQTNRNGKKWQIKLLKKL